MTLGSLYTGLGMFDYAAQQAGIEVKWQVEINEFCNKLLQVRFPNVKRFKDVKKVRGEELESTDIICGGFPCQPHSIAGNRKGGEDERNLAPDTIRIFDEVRPKWGLLENVYGLLNTDDGRFFEQEVISPMESLGYSVQPYIIPASAIGAVHRRDRLWILAHSDNSGRERHGLEQSENKGRQIFKGCRQDRTFGKPKIGSGKLYFNPTGKGLQKPEAEGIIKPLQDAERRNFQFDSDSESDNKRRARVFKGKSEQQVRGRSGNSINPDSNIERQSGQGEHRGQVHPEKNEERQEHRTLNGSEFQRPWIEVATKLCRMDAALTGGLLKPRHRKQRLEGLGNGIQWEIAYVFFQLIKQMENENL